MFKGEIPVYEESLDNPDYKKDYARQRQIVIDKVINPEGAMAKKIQALQAKQNDDTIPDSGYKPNNVE